MFWGIGCADGLDCGWREGSEAIVESLESIGIGYGRPQEQPDY